MYSQSHVGDGPPMGGTAIPASLLHHPAYHFISQHASVGRNLNAQPSELVNAAGGLWDIAKTPGMTPDALQSLTEGLYGIVKHPQHLGDIGRSNVINGLSAVLGQRCDDGVRGAVAMAFSTFASRDEATQPELDYVVDRLGHIVDTCQPGETAGPAQSAWAFGTVIRHKSASPNIADKILPNLEKIVNLPDMRSLQIPCKLGIGVTTV